VHPALAKQLSLIEPSAVRPFNVDFVSTRFQGSKRKLIEWLWSNIAPLPFDTALDVFGGTGSVSHLLKNAGKQVIYNDILRFNLDIGLALIENEGVHLGPRDVERILQRQDGVTYPSFIEDTFKDIYFTEEENRWLDQTIYNIDTLITERYARSIARFALYQACTIKRPYNLFHRANLYMRTADVERSFGNLATWNKPFPHFFRKFVAEANKCVFDNGRVNRAINTDALNCPTGVDLVYLDPPYVSDARTSTDYFGFYHFLEGLADYNAWPQRINIESKHRAIPSPGTPWTNAQEISTELRRVVERFSASTIAVSYRDDGIPSVPEISRMLADVGKNVQVVRISQKYVLSNKDIHEVFIVGC
jgi:adenine-specific DNA-methyltransferase